MRLLIISVFIFFLLSCSKKEPAIADIYEVDYFIWKNVTTLERMENEKIIVIDLELAELYNYHYPPSVMVTNEAIDPYSLQETDDTWHHLMVGRANNKADLFMTADWKMVIDAEDENAASKHLRVVRVVPKSVTEGFVNISGYQSIKFEIE